MLQHAIFSVPNTREGYTTDDNARALIVSTLLDESLTYDAKAEHPNLSRRYLAFLWLAFNSDIGPVQKLSQATTAGGLKTLAQKTAMAGHCGLWDRCSVNREMPGCAEPREDCLKLPCLRFDVYQPACMGVLHSRDASLPGLVSRRQSHPRHSQHVSQSPARHLRTESL